MSTVTPIYKNVLDLLKSRKFASDDYQREYKWAAKNIVELVNDLLNKFFQAYQTGHDPSKVEVYPDYFLGSIIVSVRNNKNYLIDG